jgi:hypothetical protein
MTADRRAAPIIICEPPADCRDPNVNRWYCMRGHADDGVPAVPGVCPLKRCREANR